MSWVLQAVKGYSRVPGPCEEVVQNTLVSLTKLAIQKIDESALQTMSRDLMWGETDTVEGGYQALLGGKLVASLGMC